MGRLGVAGSLGDDFLLGHDVLIDYRSGSVFFSRFVSERVADGEFRTSSLSGRSAFRSHAWAVDLVQQDELFYVSATVEGKTPTECLMALDTGSGESALTSDLLAGLPPTGAHRKLVALEAGLSNAKEYRARIRLTAGPSLVVPVLAGDARGPILGSNAFVSGSLLLQLRFSRIVFGR